MDLGEALGLISSLSEMLLHIHRLNVEILVRVTYPSKPLKLSIRSIFYEPWWMKTVSMQYAVSISSFPENGGVQISVIIFCVA